MTRARDLADSADLSFDAGTLVVDATNNRVGIGGSPNAILDVQGGSGADVAKIRSGSTNGTYFWQFGRNNSSGFFELGQAQGGSVTNNLIVDTAGRVGIGESSPLSALHVKGGAGANIAVQSTAGSHWRLGDGVGSSNGIFVIRDHTNSANRISILADGKTQIAQGVTFGTDTAAANTLDDYEEGSGYAVTDVSGAGLTITTSSSAYTKIGKLVHVSMYLVFPTTSNSTQIQLSLPFAAGSVATSSFSYLNGRLQPGSPLSFESAFTCQVNPSTNNFYVGYNNSTIGSVLTYNQVSGRYILVSGCYHTDL